MDLHREWSFAWKKSETKCQRRCFQVTFGNFDRYLKNSVLKHIVHVIKHVNFQIYRVHTGGIIWKKVTIDDKYINKRVWLFTYQAMSLSVVEKKKLFRRN